MKPIRKGGGIALPYQDKPGSVVVVQMVANKYSSSDQLWPLKLIHESVDQDSMALLEEAANLVIDDDPIFWGEGKNPGVQTLLRSFNTARMNRRLQSFRISPSPHAQTPNNFFIYQGIINKYLPAEMPPLLILADDSQVKMALANCTLGRYNEVKEEPLLAALAYALLFLDSQQPVFIDKSSPRQTTALDDYEPLDY